MKELIDDFLKERYFIEGETKWEELALRVAGSLAEEEGETREFFEMIINKRALPSSPVLMNAGTGGYLSACSYVPMEDSMNSIMAALNAMVKIQRDGGGTGFNFSKLRPKGSPISSGGTSSGPLAFLEGINHWSIAVKQGGKRRGANMALMSMLHPEVFDFVSIKSDLSKLSAFNLSVQANGTLFGAFNRDLLKCIASNIWEHGEPGLVFWDTVNKTCNTPWLGELEGINPCGEIPLYAWESCCLGSINLYEHLIDGKIDYDMLRKTTMTMVKLLNRVLDKNSYPLLLMKEAALRTRKIGLGVMGFADMLLAMNITYGSIHCDSIIDSIGQTISIAATDMSKSLARIHGLYPAWKSGAPRVRNAQMLAIAPTGSISFIADVSSGIEPVFSWGYTVHREGKEPYHVRNRFLRDMGWGEISNYADFPWLVTAQEIEPSIHIDTQAQWQKWIDQSISKTVNLPKETTIEEIENLIAYAYNQGCKGLTMFRSGCKRGAFLTVDEPECVECETGVCVV